MPDIVARTVSIEMPSDGSKELYSTIAEVLRWLGCEPKQEEHMDAMKGCRRV